MINDPTAFRRSPTTAAAATTITLELSNVNVIRVYDCGVAGLHRILKALPQLRHPDVKCVIVCAGMDRALPGVVGGLVHVPVDKCGVRSEFRWDSDTAHNAQ